MAAIDRVGIKFSFADLDINAVAGASPSRTLSIGHLPSVTRITTNATAGSNFTVNLPAATALKNVSLDEIRMSFAVCFTLAGQTVTINLNPADKFFCLATQTLVLTGLVDNDYQEVTIQSPPTVAFDAATDTTVRPTEWTIESAVNASTGIAEAESFGYVNSLGAQAITVESPIVFSGTAVVSGGIIHPDASTFLVADAGTYEIEWVVTVTEASQLALFDGGVFVPGTDFGAAANAQNVGSLVLVLAAGASLTINNHTSTAGTINLPATLGGAVGITNATFLIRRLA